jgi:C-terminal processing protease CtpA/Prc
LDEDGNIVYKLGILSDTNDVSISLQLLLESNGYTRKENVSLFEYLPIAKDKTNSYRYYEIDNIPILEVNCLCRVTPEDNTIEDFIEDSKKLKEKDNIIIDLRNNNGGSLISMEEWYEGFTGTKLRKDIVESGLYTNTSISLSKDKFESKKNEPDDVKDKCLEKISSYEDEEYYPGWSPIEYEDFRPVKNKANIFILVDKNTSSAAEFFTYYLKKLDNVTIVGTNTNGCMLTGNCNSTYLPNSNIPINISHKIYLNKNFTNIDGLGLSPDLWIKPERSLDRIVKYINNNI